jgi:predicted phage-related endonuclease
VPTEAITEAEASEVEVALDEVTNLLEAYRVADRTIREWEAIRSAISNQIRYVMGEKEIGTVGGEPVVRWTRYKQRRLSPALVAEHAPDVVEKCYVTTEARRFTVVDR